MRTLLFSIVAAISLHVTAKAQESSNTDTLIEARAVVYQAPVVYQSTVVYQAPVIYQANGAEPRCAPRCSPSVIYIGRQPCPQTYSSCRNSSVIYFGRMEARERGYHFNHRR